MTRLRFNRCFVEGIPVLRFSKGAGVLPDQEREKLFQEIRLAVEPDWEYLVMDVTWMGFVFSAFLGKLITFWKNFRDRGGRFVICGENLPFFEVLQITRLDQLWEVHAGQRSEPEFIAELFADSFPTPTFDAFCLAWNDSTIVKMAQVIQAERAFDDLPILADALEEAGCSDAKVLSHCRSGWEHGKGCWVLRQILSNAK